MKAAAWRGRLVVQVCTILVSRRASTIIAWRARNAWGTRTPHKERIAYVLHPNATAFRAAASTGTPQRKP